MSRSSTQFYRFVSTAKLKIPTCTFHILSNILCLESGTKLSIIGHLQMYVLDLYVNTTRFLILPSLYHLEFVNRSSFISAKCHMQYCVKSYPSNANRFKVIFLSFF